MLFALLRWLKRDVEVCSRGYWKCNKGKGKAIQGKGRVKTGTEFAQTQCYRLFLLL